MARIHADRIAVQGDRVLVVPHDELVYQTETGIILPDQSVDRQKYRQWRVHAVGPDVVDLQPGDRVILDGRFAGVPFEWNDVLVRVVKEPYVIAVIT